MGETAADTARELAALRTETDRLVDALERRAERALEVPRQLSANRALVPVLGVVAVLAVALLWYRSWRRAVRARREAAERRRIEAWERLLGVRRRPRPAAEPAAPSEDRAAEPGLLQRTLGAAAATIILALVDLVARRFSASQWSTIQREAEPPAKPPEEPAADTRQRPVVVGQPGTE